VRTPIVTPSDHNFVPALAQFAMFYEIHRSSAGGLVIRGVHRRIIVFINTALGSCIVDVSVIVVESGNTATLSVRRG
jgi:hypothetical protein